MIKDYPGSLYGRYRNPKFTDVYDNAEDFLADYKDVGIPTSISDESATTLFFLLYGKYGNSTIAASDLTRFKYRLFSIIWQHGPTWEKKIDIQKTVRAWAENEITISETLVVNLHTTLTLLVVLRTRHKVRLVTHLRLLERTILRQQLLLTLL